jgi:hypothetical protein
VWAKLGNEGFGAFWGMLTSAKDWRTCASVNPHVTSGQVSLAMMTRHTIMS